MKVEEELNKLNKSLQTNDIQPITIMDIENQMGSDLFEITAVLYPKSKDFLPSKIRIEDLSQSEMTKEVEEILYTKIVPERIRKYLQETYQEIIRQYEKSGDLKVLGRGISGFQSIKKLLESVRDREIKYNLKTDITTEQIKKISLVIQGMQAEGKKKI